ELANGRAVLACMPEAECRQHLERAGADSPELREELARVRATGIAVNRGGWDIALSAVGAAIVDADGAPIAGIGVYGPRERIDANLDSISPAVLAAAREIELTLAERHR